ncbi:outer membrane beta-barrel protein [Chitinophaga cymbidii]|nr:outer membrane beta-barrel protein [Chitinophaga cymbidii]
MLRIVPLMLVLIASLHARAQQKMELKGTVADSASHELLEMATVTVQDSKDSSLITYTLTDKRGAFRLQGIPADKPVRFLVSYTGYHTHIKTLPPGRPADLGRIILAPAPHELNTVVVEGNRPPVSIRQDTIEFNASSFKTRPNAVVEDLLKKLPGVDIDEEGNITVNGKKVSRILVDGREFFANDPKLATKNLPSAIIEKVQVVDTKTKQEARMNVQKDGEDKTINLTLKADKKKGLFGRLSAGGGTDERFELGGMANAFNGARQISILGSSNNLNKVGFTQSEIFSTINTKNGIVINSNSNGSFAINGIGFGGTGDGIRTTSMIGYNYNDKWNKTDVNNSYFFNNSDARFRTLNTREYLNGDGHLFTSSDRNGYSRNANHRVNFNFDIELDSTLRLTLAPAYDYTKASSNASGNEITTAEDGSLVNTNESSNRALSTNHNFSNTLGLTKQLRKKGRSIGLQFTNNYTTYNEDAYNRSDVEYYENEAVTDDRHVDQLTIADNKNERYRISISYTEPLSATWKMTAGYGFDYNANSSNRQTYNYDPDSKTYTDLDDAYTNRFRTINTSQTPNLVLSHNSEKWRVSVGGSLYLNLLDNYSYTTNTSLKQYQTNFAPNSRVSYKLKNGGYINLGYNGNMQQPTLEQLQPVPDNTNPLNVRIGNPDLKPSFSQQIRFGYDRFTPNGIGVFSGVTFSPILNRFSTASFINSKGERTTQTINVDGAYNMNANFSLSKSKKTKDMQYRISGGAFINGSRNISYSNTGNAAGDTTLYRNIALNWSYSPYVMFNYAWKELLDISTSYRPTYTDARYKPANSTQGSFFVQRATLGTTLYWPGNFSWDNDVNYSYNSRITPGFQQHVVLWNMGLAYDFFKDKSLQLKLSAFDLLRQNTSVRRMVNELYIEDVQTDIVEQYFMLTATWNFSKFGAKPKGGNRRMDGGRNMFMF